MKKAFQCSVVALIVAFCFGELALAEGAHHHFVLQTMPVAHAGGMHPDTAESYPPAGLNPASANFTTSPYAIYGPGNAFNSDGRELWPCIGAGTANPDCTYIGDPRQPNFGLVGGVPYYDWPLTMDGNDFCLGASAADANIPCGQVISWFEDNDYEDTTDHLLYTFTAMQGTSYIADTGTIDFGPVPSFSGPFLDGFGLDTNFGTLGQTGVNNGNCDKSFSYPLSSESYPGEFGIAAGKTCVNPTQGVADLAVTWELATPHYKKVTSGTINGVSCTSSAPCYTVTFAKKYSTTQKWNIYLYNPPAGS